MITKTALDIAKLRGIVKDVVAPKFIRYGQNGRSLMDSSYHMPRVKAFNKQQVRGMAEGAGNLTAKRMSLAPDHPHIERLKGSVLGQLKDLGVYTDQPRHIVWGNKGNRQAHQLFPKGMGGEAQRASNDLIALHENNELLHANKYQKALSGADPKNLGAASHFSPDVLFKEHNALSTLSGADPAVIQKTREAFRHFRNTTGETGALDDILPGRYATGPRINRRYRKYLTDKVFSQMNPS